MLAHLISSVCYQSVISETQDLISIQAEPRATERVVRVVRVVRVRFYSPGSSGTKINPGIEARCIHDLGERREERPSSPPPLTTGRESFGAASMESPEREPVRVCREVCRASRGLRENTSEDLRKNTRHSKLYTGLDPPYSKHLVKVAENVLTAELTR